MNNFEEALTNEYQKKGLFYFQEERKEMLQYIPQNIHKILDVGCGNGNFSGLLKKMRNIEVWGVELNKQAASIAAQKLDRVICEPFDSRLSLPRNNFDCIIFNDVLEHMIDPFTALLYSKELLSEQGVVVASIPNVRYFDNIWNLLFHKNWQYAESGILDRTHLRFFTRRSILETLDALSFTIESLEGINPVEERHPWRARRFHILNWLLFNQIEDMRYQQFAIVARPYHP
jgi:2-polyprenyl-3-methyl-5-hydroxy-6-metoxy-1,4-benzoquinol methylase